jgi:hypothetical protein
MVAARVNPGKLRRWAVIALVLVFSLVPNASAAVVADPPLAAGSWQSFLTPVESVLGSRRRMIQLAFVGVCIGLYILMRHR